MILVSITAFLLLATLVLAFINRLKQRYPLLIYSIALLSLYQTSLLGAGVVGSDIQPELYYARQALLNGWNYVQQAESTSNLSIVIGLLAPFLSWVFSIDLIVVFKWIFPAVLALAPVILYYAFRKMISERSALYSSLFFIIIPVFNMEIVSIAKSMIAEVFLAMGIWIIMSDIRSLYKTGCLILLAIMTLMCHYTVGIFFLWYLAGIVGFVLVGRILRIQIFQKPCLKVFVVAFVISLLFGFGYFSVVGSGQLFGLLSNIAGWWSNDHVTSSFSFNAIDSLQRQPQFVKSGIGLDFFDASFLGKIFRIVQYFTQMMILIGAIYVILRRKSFKSEFIAGAATALVMLGICVLVPNFSAIANMTRFYHVSLFFLAPCFILGFEIFKKNKTWIFSGILIVYYLFVSGIIFEVAKISTITKFEIPYSHALSSDRAGTVGVYTQDDLKCAQWLSEKSDKNLMIESDWYGMCLLSNYMSYYPRMRDSIVYAKAHSAAEIGGVYYLFLTDWNFSHNQYVMVYERYTGGTGLRDLASIPDLSNAMEIYSSHNSKIYLVGAR